MPKRVKDTYYKLGEILLRRKLAPTEAIDEALAFQRAALAQKRTPPRLGQILVERKILTARDIREILEQQKIGRGEKRVLKVNLRSADGVAVVSLKGRLDVSKEEAVTKVLEALMNRGYARIAVDAVGLIRADSHGISCLVAYVDEARARGGDLKFFGMNSDVKFLFDRVGLLRFVQAFDREEEAIRAFDLSIDEYMSRGALAEYVAPEAGRTFHLSYCLAAQKIPDDQRIYFESKWHAREAGRHPCKRCRP